MVHRSGRDPTPIFLPIESQDMGKGAGGIQTYFSIDDSAQDNQDRIINFSLVDFTNFVNEANTLQKMMNKGRVLGFQLGVDVNSLVGVSTTWTLRKNQVDTPHVIVFSAGEIGTKDTKSFTPIEFEIGDAFTIRIQTPLGAGQYNTLIAVLVEYDGTPS